MKSFKEYYEVLNEEELYEDLAATDILPSMPPAMLVMKRKTLRQTGTGENIAVYHIDKINKYVIVPPENLENPFLSL